MKGVKKLCCGLSLVFFIIFGLSFVASSDVSALKYAYDAFPLYHDVFTDCDSSSTSSCNYRELGRGFYVWFDNSNQSFSLDPYYSKNTSVFSICSNAYNLTQYQILHSTSISSNHIWGVQSHQEFSKFLFNPNNVCFDDDWQHATASSWAFDSIYSSSYNLSNGDTTKILKLSNALFDSSNSGYDSGSIKSIQIPLTVNDQLSHFSANTPLSWDFGLVTDSANNFPYISSSISANLYLEYFTSPDDSSSFFSSYVSNSSSPISCTVDRDYRFQVRNSEEYHDYLGLNFHCEFTPTTDVYYLHPALNIYGGSYDYNPSTFLTYDYHGIYFTGTFLVTDNDDTWSGIIANPSPSGFDLENSPSFIQINGYPDDNSPSCSADDFLCNLFSFNFINPFAPIFNLFTQNDSCVSIPTIAGMIHSESSTVCPFFDSTTRNIVTPILGLSAMMLVFGFVVRWLGSRSGNFIEDSGGIDSGGYHFQNKFRRSK